MDEHRPPEALAYQRHDVPWCLRQAEQVGPHGHELVQTLFADRVMDHLRAVQGLIHRRHTYGAGRLEAGCRRALAFDSPQYRTVKTILDNGLDHDPLPAPAPVPLAAAYTGQGRCCRDRADLFGHDHRH